MATDHAVMEPPDQTASPAPEVEFPPMTVTVTTWLPMDPGADAETADLVTTMMQSGAAIGAMPVTFGGRRYLAVLGHREEREMPDAARGMAAAA
jgi:hypothetical protein